VCIIAAIIAVFDGSRIGTSSTRIQKIANAGFVFLLARGYFLTQDGTIFFLMGMVAFIVTHLINGGLLLRLQSVRFTFATMMGVILALGAIGIVYYWLHDFLGTFSIPVVLYMFIIGSVLVLAFNVSNNTLYKNIAYTCFIPGMFLFTVSDSLLALNKFLLHNPTGWDIWIMVTYALAQWLLTEGYISVVNGTREESKP